MTNTNETLAQLAQNPRANRKKLNELARATLRSITSSKLELLVALADHGHWCVLVQPKDAVDAAALMAKGLVLRDEETEHRVMLYGRIHAKALSYRASWAGEQVVRINTEDQNAIIRGERAAARKEAR